MSKTETTEFNQHFTVKKLLKYTWPTIAMTVSTSVYSMVDGLFVSNYAGTTAFAAINLAWPYIAVVSELEDILVPIFICVVLPVSIVLITAISKMNRDKHRSNVLIKAIEANNNIDTNKLAEALKKPEKSERQILNQRLLRGCMFSLIGLVLLIVGIYNFVA